ncbi:hypothetical protein Pogu_0660 [Pyrobaculum oguniense TE7]|uniref:Uncharacterized protein n=1 Tax=Pyrobaculum oguniense (strain DSM 13380 / JCM 10595 / TE7) TaxID=698757 RepID=H6Q7E3_PYROT|nr:hypothetical protein Pogu_0660 [Pyrobaculum oguniense TE7]
MLGWVDHFQYYGPLKVELLEVPEVLLSSIVLTRSEEGFERAVSGWSKFGTLNVVEAVYAYVVQARRGVLDRRGLLEKILSLIPSATELDILAMQRVLKLGLDITTCDLGVVVLSYIPVRSGAPPPRFLGILYELKRGDSTLYIARNQGGSPVYDLETMCVIPASGEGEPHPLYDAYLRGFKIVTEGTPSAEDLCVAHKKIGARCRAFRPGAF